MRDIPQKYQQLYDRAMSGKSRKAAVRCACLDCCGWVSEEVNLCTDTGCPLWPYRPASDVSGSTDERGFSGAEAKKSVETANITNDLFSMAGGRR